MRACCCYLLKSGGGAAAAAGNFTEWRSEVRCEFGEAFQFEQTLTGRRSRNLFVLEDPGKRMTNEDSMQTRGQRWIDVGARTVADHPSGVRRQFVLIADLLKGVGVL